MDINQRTIQSSIAQTLHIKSICKIEGKNRDPITVRHIYKRKYKLLHVIKNDFLMFFVSHN
jgi:hypothetical protein